ncbi:MAG: hybrid sensor histidine kinase/response regulator [Gemmatimonadales bacterium]
MTESSRQERGPDSVPQERIFRTMLERLPAAAYMCDSEGRITWFNRQAVELWGREPVLNDTADLLCGSFRAPDGTPIDHMAWMAPDLREETANEGREIVVERPDGSRRFVLAHATPLRDEAGRFAGTVHVLVDTTARREAEEARRRSEETLSRFMEHLPGLAWIKDRDGRYLFANEAALRAFGRTREQLYGRRDTEIFPLESATAFQDNDRKVLAGSDGIETIETLAHADGVHHSLVSKFTIPGPDGAPSLIGGIAIDITDHKLVDTALSESEARFRHMADNAPVLIWVAGLEGRDFVNREALRFLGVTAEQVLGNRWTEFVHPDDRAVCLRAYEEAWAQRDVFTAQFRMRRADGAWRWMRSTAIPRFTEDGAFIGLVGCKVDITEMKVSQDLLREADQRKDEFLATLAHELRNPLAPLRYSLEILRMDGGGPAARRVHDMMERQINHMDRLVDDLLDVSRITRGKIELRRGRVDLAAIVRAALETSQPIIELSHHELSVKMPAETLYLEADPVRLAQVLANLLNNAAKYTDEGGRIWLQAEAGNGEVMISVRDDGIGITPEMLPRVFDLFTQVDQTLGRSRGGLGIGLTLARQLVEMHGGRIEARSPGEGRGSEFLVTLPLAAEQSPRATASADVGLEPGQRRRRVLIVDDNQDSADALGTLLQASGMEVHIAYDGPSALSVFDECEPSIVLLDLGLPGMDGYVVASRMRERPGGKEARLIAVTGWGHPEARRRSREVGFDHHLVKPVKLETLRAVLASVDPGGAAVAVTE